VVIEAKRAQNREIQEIALKVNYDAETDTLTIELKPGKIAESDESKPAVILDFDQQGNLLGLEILEASKRSENPEAVEFAVS
jgi:uncharacterized protein YuzE